MNAVTPAVFDLPDRLAAKADPGSIDDDLAHFAAIADTLDTSIAELSDRLDAARQARGGSGQVAMERDQEVHRLTARRRTLRRYGLDLCLGRMVPADGSAPVYVGRLGLRDAAGRSLLVDWRSPAAEPFFGATHAQPMGLASRRRYRWTRGRITDYWDEVFDPSRLDGQVALDDQSAFIASLGDARSERMRDVLGTIQADQDAIIRRGSAGTLVVDGGPGTGKTVVALHRCAYLLYADPRLGHHRGGLLFVGPHQPYLAYVSDVLPSLGEEGVQTCTLSDLVAEGATAGPEPDPLVAQLKSTAAMVGAIEPAVRFHEEPPTVDLAVPTPWSELRLRAADWAEAFDAVEPGTPHNEARETIRDALVDILADQDAGRAPAPALRESLRRHPDLTAALHRAWPLVEAADLVTDLWTVPAYLRRCAPWLDPADVRRLQRPAGAAWTVPDLPLLDAARRRLGNPAAAGRARRRAAATADRNAEMSRVIEHLIESDDSELAVMSMLRGADLRDALIDEDALPGGDGGGSDRTYAHVMVDEAQELTDAQWQMLLARCPSGSFTVVGDRAQARHGFTRSWVDRLARAGLNRIEVASLTINYRTPAEVMEQAEPVIRAAIPDANVPTSVRRSGRPVRYGRVAELRPLLAAWLAAQPDGIACVIGDPDFEPGPRVRSLSPQLAKGLEFDLVVLVDPDSFGIGDRPAAGDGAGDGTGDAIAAAVDRYVAMTRTTGDLVILAGR